MSGHTEALLMLFLAFTAARLLGHLFQRFKLPVVVGELLAGAILGPQLLDLVHSGEILDTFAELGVIMLLFMAGLETHIEELLETRAAAIKVAVLGAALPFIGGAAARPALRLGVERRAVHGDGAHRHLRRHHRARAARARAQRDALGAHHPRRGGARRRARPHRPRRRQRHRARQLRRLQPRAADRRGHRLRRACSGSSAPSSWSSSATGSRTCASRSSSRSAWSSRSRSRCSPTTSAWRPSSAPSSPGSR